MAPRFMESCHSQPPYLAHTLPQATTGVPYVAMYTEYGPGEDNVNDYLRTPTVRRARREG